MIVVTPIAVTTANLTSNVAITETEWTAGTHNRGVQLYEDDTLYEVTADPSTTDQPSVGAVANPPTWVKVGKINRFKMFNNVASEKTEAAAPIEVTIVPGESVNTVGLFEIENGSSVQVEVEDPTEGVLYDQTIDLVDYSAINDVYDYGFGEFATSTEALFLDLPNLPLADINITINGTGTVGVGRTTLGRQQSIGVTTQDVRIGIEDFSRTDTDEFGQINFIQRRFSRLMNATVFVESALQDSVLRRLAALRATPALYIGGEDFLETYIFGFYRDFTIGRTGPSTAEMQIEIEGIAQ